MLSSQWAAKLSSSLQNTGTTFECAPSHLFIVWPNEEMQLTTVSRAVYFLWYLYMATMLNRQKLLIFFFFIILHFFYY